MKNFGYITSIFLATLSVSSICIGSVVYSDGGTHVISTKLNDNVYVDQGAPGVGTHVELTSTGAVNFPYGFYAYNDSVITVLGGDIQGRGLNLFDRSRLTMTGGNFSSSIYASGNSAFTIGGGSTASALAMYNQATGQVLSATFSMLFIRDSSRLLFSGGFIQENICAGSSYMQNHASLIQFAGSNFKVNGLSVPIGSSLRTYATWTLYDGEYCLSGRLTGTLANGGTLNNMFYIYDSSNIVVIPEPSMLLLLLCGMPLLRKRNLT